MRRLIFIIVLAALLASCSTTSKLAEDEVLYTGVKKLSVTAPDSVAIPSDVKSNISELINVPANNSWYSPYVRSPFPLGLWLYNHWPEDASGLKGWIYRKFAETPVLMSDVRPDLRMKMVEDMLEKNGYYGSTTSYDLVYSKKNHKKARVLYSVKLAAPKTIAEIRYLPDTTELNTALNRYMKRDRYLRLGEVICNDSLSVTRTRVTNRLRNHGYYYFRPEYITFYADTLMQPGHVVLQVTYADKIPEKALWKYYVGDVNTLVLRNDNAGVPDTIQTEKGRVVQMRPSRLRKNLIPSCIDFNQGDEVRVNRLSNTQSYLSRLGIFDFISLVATPLDSVRTDTLDLDIICRFDKPIETQIEANLTSKSNSYLGPGLSYQVLNRNIFGGGERLTIKLDASYEWQIGKVDGKRSRFNSYEFGLQTELAFPRLLAPKFIPFSKRQQAWTRISLGGTVMNRPKFFKMAQFDVGLSYDWQASRYSQNQVTLFGLKYNKLLTTTEEFDATMAENPAIALSFRDQFIPKLSYTYTYDRGFGRPRDNHHFTLQLSFMEAGNLFSGLWAAAGSKDNKQLFGTPFSQFVKASLQAIYSKRITGEQRLVGRVYVGAAHAYGNSTEVPYAEQFYAGGANSIRAFQVRSIGPGSYHSANNGNNYYDQTGTFRFEMNAEYRFPIVSVIKGAVFVDAGNIWLLKEDTSRPGAKLDGNFLKDLALGTGLGLRLDMGMIVVRADLGVGLHLPYDTGKPGYYNMTRFKDSLALNLAIGYPF